MAMYQKGHVQKWLWNILPWGKMAIGKMAIGKMAMYKKNGHGISGHGNKIIMQMPSAYLRITIQQIILHYYIQMPSFFYIN